MTLERIICAIIRNALLLIKEFLLFNIMSVPVLNSRDTRGLSLRIDNLNLIFLILIPDKLTILGKFQQFLFNLFSLLLHEFLLHR